MAWLAIPAALICAAAIVITRAIRAPTLMRCDGWLPDTRGDADPYPASLALAAASQAAEMGEEHRQHIRTTEG